MKKTMMMAVAAFALATGNAAADQVDSDCRWWMNYPSNQEDAMLMQAGRNPDAKREIPIQGGAEFVTRAYEHPFAIDGHPHVLTTYSEECGFRLLRIDPARAQALARYCSLRYFYLGYKTVTTTVEASNGTWTVFVQRRDYRNWQAISQEMNALVPVILPRGKQP